MRNEMLRGRVLRYMYAFRLSRCGTRVAVCQQHFARRHLTQSRNNDENDFFSFPPSSLFLFQHDRSFFQSRFYTAAREKNDDYPRSVNAKISSTGAYDVFSLYRLYIEKSIGNDIRDNRGFEESLSFVKQFLAARLKRGPWKFARKIRLFQRRSLSSRYPPSVYPCRAVFQHATIRWLWSRRWILRTRRIMSFSPKKGEREERGGGGEEEKKVE